jgi:hypothetical protein
MVFFSVFLIIGANVPALLVSCELRERIFSTKLKIFQRKIDNRLKQNSQLRETAVGSSFS